VPLEAILSGDKRIVRDRERIEAVLTELRNSTRYKILVGSLIVAILNGWCSAGAVRVRHETNYHPLVLIGVGVLVLQHILSRKQQRHICTVESVAI
jgi:hypothetical protein